MNDTRYEDNHFRTCPECHSTDGYLNAGNTHVFFCKNHKKRWVVGFNLFSSCQNETEEEQRRMWTEAGADDFEDITDRDELFATPAWLKSAEGQEWLASANIADLCGQQWQLVLRQTGLPEHEEAYNIIEHAIRGDEPPAAA